MSLDFSSIIMKRFSIAFCILLCCIACQHTPNDNPAASPVSASQTSPQSLDPTRAGLPANPTASSSPTATLGDSNHGTVYFVRPDGGAADQCSGLVDAPFSVENSPDCAWNNPFQALPPLGSPRIAGGDALIISAGGYEMGYGAPGSDACDAEGAYDCYMPPVPSGIDAAHPTRILGEGWASGCSDQPQLWGSERTGFIINLAGSSNVEIACLEITDHSECVESQENGLPCERDTPPYGDWAATGLYAEDSTNVHLLDLNIHGLAVSGVLAGRLADWTVENVRIAANGWAGWDGDIGDESSNSGTMLFRRLRVEWNGCGETYPGGEPTRCWAQSAGGYGDGLGTGATGGIWVIEDSAFLHNTSDGLDLLYARHAGARIEIRRTIAEGNAGNQIKTTGPTAMENVIAVGNCGFFDGQPFTYRIDDDGDGALDSSSVDPCRAGGDTIAMDLNPGDQIRLVNSTVAGEGGCLVIATCAFEKDCTGATQNVTMINDIFEGGHGFMDPGEDVCFAWFNDEGGSDRLSGNPFSTAYSIVHGVRFGNVDPCAEEANLCGIPAGILNAGMDAFDAHLQPGSPAVDAGLPSTAPQTDFDGRLRDARPDIGAYEWRAPSAAMAFPIRLILAGISLIYIGRRSWNTVSRRI
jgi:hypothetical protein